MDLSELSIRDLLGVAAVAAHGHFGRAAASLRIAQPTLSAQVVKVETTLGVTLFERTARKFLITPDGQRLLPLVRELLAAAERLEAHAGQGARERAASPFRLGVIPTLGPYLMPYLLLPLRREHPRLRLSIAEHQTAKLLELLLDGTLDAAFLSLPVRHHSLEALPLFDEPFRLIAPVGSAIAAHKRLLPSRLAACDMILLEDGHCLRQQSISVCTKRGGPTPRLVTTSLETLKYLVAAHAGYSLLPGLACDLPAGLRELVGIRNFDDQVPSRRIGLCCRRTLPRRRDAIDLADFVRSHPPPGVHAIQK